MPAFVSISRHFTNADIMVQDLLRAVPLTDTDDTIGFLSCNPDVPYKELIAGLHDAAFFPVVGGTSLASPFEPGDEDISARLTVLSKKNLHRAVSVSEPLRGTEGKAQMERLYQDCLTRLGNEPKMFFAILPIIENLMADIYLPHLFSLAGATPVFGGMVSDDFDSDNFAVLVQGESYADRIALVALGGDIEPVFSVGCELTVLSDYSPTVTEADGFVVHKVDDVPFCEYLRKLGFSDGEVILSDYPVSVLIRGGMYEEDGLPEIHPLLQTNPNEGCGTFGSPIPVGVKISLGVLTKGGIERSAEYCVGELAQKIRKKQINGYEFTMLFCVSCVSRYFVLVGQENVECGILNTNLPPKLPMYGYYAFNEICPTQNSKGGLLNRAHSDSIVMCAF